uniref:Fibrosin n=1 Tax=Monodelphis domestica TaxID=13616 RepID=F7BB08_MONDO
SRSQPPPPPPPPARPWSSASSGERGSPRGKRRRRRPPRPRGRKRPPGSGSRGEEEDDDEEEEGEEEEEEEEEDLIDGFAIASFASLEALQKDASLQPPERLEHRLKHSGKRKRGGVGGGRGEPGDSSERETGRPPGDRARKRPSKRRRKEVRYALPLTILSFHKFHMCYTISSFWSLCRNNLTSKKRSLLLFSTPSLVIFPSQLYAAFPPAVPGLPPGLPPAVSFGSLQGAFQPKSTNPELPPRLGPVPSGLPQKGTQIPDHFRPPLRKPGKWCAMHVRVAYMILRHQEKMKGDPHKLDFRNDLLPCLPGAYGGLPPGQELSHPASLFTATGAVHPAANPFTAAPGPPTSFLSPGTHIDPFGRPTSFASLAALSNGAFGGLGSPTFNTGAVFAQKESPGAPPAFASPPDPWARLHRGPPAFPAWARPPEAARTPGSDKERPVERREPSAPKEEKDRDLPFSRPQLRVSPATPKSRAGEEGVRPPKEPVRVKDEKEEEVPEPPSELKELGGAGAVATARLYGLEPTHPLLYGRLAPPPPTAAPGPPQLLSKTPPGALLGAPPPLVPAPRPGSPPRPPGPPRADR